MRILEYSSNDKINCEATAEIIIKEHELCVIDNALFELSEKEGYKNSKQFMEVYIAFHLLREFVNHGHIGSDEIKMAHDKYDRLGKYEAWKELEKKKEREK